MNPPMVKFVKNEHTQTKYFMSGGFGGVCTVVLGYPFDTIKVKLQAMPIPALGEDPIYRGTWDCAVKTVKKEGFTGMYRGMAAPVVGVAPVFAISFLAFNTAKRMQQSTDDSVLNQLQLFGAGAFSGFLTTVVMAPGERVKCLLQVQHDILGPKKYKGPADVVRKLYKEGGIRNLYKETAATLLRDVPGSGLYFMTYEVLQQKFKSGSLNEPNIFGTIFAGGMAGILFWIAGCPADILKTRLQIAPEGRYPGGLRQVYRELVKEEGIAALYKGCVPIFARSFPANATCFAGFELAMHFFDNV